MEDIIEIVKSHKESGLLAKGINQKIKNEAKERKGEFLPMLLGALAARILGTAFTGKRIIRIGEGVKGACQNF